MKKSNILIIGILVVAAILVIWWIGTYNSLVSARENVDGEFSNVSIQLERRADLIPNLVATVKGYVKHEQAAIDSVTSAREKLLKADDIDEMAEANDELNSAIDALFIIVENYPDLKASTNFINLQDELAGTENRIATARRDYNSAVKDYNTMIKKIPTNIIASICDFDDADYFEVDEEKIETPDVEF